MLLEKLNQELLFICFILQEPGNRPGQCLAAHGNPI